MTDGRLHVVQAGVLDILRHTESARFGELRRPSGLPSDSFKHHLRALLQNELISKRPDGAYSLTPKGKEFANNLDARLRAPQKQPKLTLRVCLSRTGKDGSLEYLFQKRRRNPFWGYWDTIGGPVQWGESIESAASRELLKQTGLTAELQVKAFYRVRDYTEATGELLEDKLFAILGTSEYSGELTNAWAGGFNQWMTMEALIASGKYFESTPKMLAQLQSGGVYAADEVRYGLEEY